MKLRMLIVIFLLLTCGAMASGKRVHVPLPADLQGELNGVPYLIRVPANWNGTLLVYSYGYAEAFTDPLPLAPPIVDVNTLLAKGFALAGIHAAGAVKIPGAATDAGWNVKERIENTAAVTAAFRGLVGRPRRHPKLHRSQLNRLSGAADHARRGVQFHVAYRDFLQRR